MIPFPLCTHTICRIHKRNEDSLPIHTPYAEFTNGICSMTPVPLRQIKDITGIRKKKLKRTDWWKDFFREFLSWKPLLLLLGKEQMKVPLSSPKPGGTHRKLWICSLGRNKDLVLFLWPTNKANIDWELRSDPYPWNLESKRKAAERFRWQIWEPVAVLRLSRISGMC